MNSWPVMRPHPGKPPEGTILCWRIVVTDIDRETRPRLFELMSAAEQARALRFVKEADRRSFTAAHGGLRLLLGTALAMEPRSFAFEAGRYGKPALASGAVQFNMSHSGGIVLIALADGMPIGADVEMVRPLPDRDEIVRRYFHPGEVADLAALEEGSAAPLAFFRCWSRKEAVVKALGLGMSLDLHRYRVSCRPGDKPALLALENEENPSEAWTVVDLEPTASAGHAYVGAVAARSNSLNVSCRTLDLRGL